MRSVLPAILGTSIDKPVRLEPFAPPGGGTPDCHMARLRTQASRISCAVAAGPYSFASRALALGEGLPMIGKLLGHTQVQTTTRYAHLARDTVKASAARIGDSIERDLAMETD